MMAAVGCSLGCGWQMWLTVLTFPLLAGATYGLVVLTRFSLCVMGRIIIGNGSSYVHTWNLAGSRSDL